MLLSLKENHEQAMKRDDVKAVVLTGNMTKLYTLVSFSFSRTWIFSTRKMLMACADWAGARGKFSGGADITSFGGGKSNINIIAA